jgi:hypothetical protein
MAESSMISQQTSSLAGGADVSVFVRWRPLIKEEAGHEEITRSAQTDGAMQRVVFNGQKCMAGTNVPVTKTVKATAASLPTPMSPRSKHRARLARKMRKREQKANTFNGVLHGVFEADANNQTVYERSVEPCVKHVLNGGVGAVFTYGQTGSGKTHTILGYGEERGLAYRSINAMHEHLQSLEKDDAYILVSFTEMHRRSVYDLLNNRNAAAARENAEGDVVFRSHTKTKDRKRDDTQGFSVRKIKCRSVEDAAAAIQLGIDNRIVGESNVHSQSSRSHAFLEYEISNDEIESYKSLIVTLENEIVQLMNKVSGTKKRCVQKINSYTLDQKQEQNQTFLQFMTPKQLKHRSYGLGWNGVQNFYKWLIKRVEAHVESLQAQQGACFKGKMVLVDLAGAEYGADKRNKSQSKEEWQEAKQINVSLSALNDVISAQHSGKKRVPYRASILTRILRKYLSKEQCRTVMIGNLSSSLIHSTKSIKTLRYCCMVAKAARKE